MNIEKLISAQKWAQDELNKCVDFWLKNGIDRVNGGVYTCLDRAGKVYSTDKSVWMQGRCAWTFSRLCNQYGNRKEWLEAAKSCLDFLENHCKNPEADGRLYFTVTADGKPLRQRRYYFSESFYIIANAEYYGATGEKEHLERARKYYEMLYKLNNGLIKDPTGLGSKTITETRTGRALADPMIFLNTTAIMRKFDIEHKELYDKYSKESAEQIVKYFYKPELGCTLESVALDGTPQLDFTAGRVVNPGHDIECSWFLAEEAEYLSDDKLMEDAISIFNFAANKGWDDTYGGILMFIDCLGNPPEAYEHDMKLWWPHNELMIASLMFYKETREEKYLDWFFKTLEYCKEHFCEAEYGEWYGYLRRDGKPTEPAAKGSTFKGPFHVPRCLMVLDEIIPEILAMENQ